MDMQLLAQIEQGEHLYRFFGDLYSRRPSLDLLKCAASIPLRCNLPDSNCWRKYISYASGLRNNNTSAFEGILPALCLFYDNLMGDNLLEMYEYSFYLRKDDYAYSYDRLDACYADYPYRNGSVLDTGHIALQLYYMADLRSLSQKQAYDGDACVLKEGIIVQQMFYKNFLAVWWPFFAYEMGTVAGKCEFYRETAALFKCFMADDTVFMQELL